jgi:pantothenate kinase type III
MLGMVQMALGIMGATCGGDGVLVVSGGSAPALLPHLPQDARHVPDLVFEGMELVDRDSRP